MSRTAANPTPAPRGRAAAGRRRPAIPATAGAVTIRPVRRGDLEQVIALDAVITGIEKRSYWERIYRRYALGSRGEQRWFLVAMAGRDVAGFVIAEVRDWEFGSPPCGWLFTIDVDPNARQSGIGTRLLTALLDALRGAGVLKLRTMLAHQNTLIHAFFRSQGMMAAPLIPMEMDV